MQRQHLHSLVRNVGVFVFMTALCVGTVAMAWPYDAGAAALLFLANLAAISQAKREKHHTLCQMTEGVVSEVNNELSTIIRGVRERRGRDGGRSNTD